MNVLGAPLASGHLDGQLPDGPFAWHTLLPDGTLMKADASGGPPAKQSAAPVGIDEILTCSTAAGITILHPDGSTSRQQQEHVVLADGSAVTAAGWLHSSTGGQLTWTIDQVALERLKSAAALAAAEASAAAEAAAAAAAAAEEAAAAEAASKKGGKGDKARALDKQRSGAKSHGSAAFGSAAGDGAVVAGAGSPSSITSTSTHESLQSVLQQLELLEPISKGHIRAACLTDPDTRAVVSTREDHVMVVSYTDGSKLLQVSWLQICSTIGYLAQGVSPTA